MLEVVIAIVVLAACVLPAANALRASVQAPSANARAAHNLECVETLMETVMATPYDVLYALANNNGPAAYPIPTDASCPARQVTIMQYGNDTTKTIGPGGTSPYLLYVSVALANAADGNPFTLTSLVTR